MSLGLHLRHRVCQEVRQELKAGLYLDYEIVPQTTCPFCGTIVEPIQQNWESSVTDCRLICPNCHKKFQGLLQIFQKEGINVGTYHFLCPTQTLHQLREILASGRKRLGEKFLHDKHPEIYFSAIKNFGTYKNARQNLKKSL